MFHHNYIADDQSYLVVDYDHFSLTVGILKFHKRKPKLETCVRSFFGPEEREFTMRSFERNFLQCCEELKEKAWQLPKDVCIFIDHGESVVTSTGYTFSREHSDKPLQLEEIDAFATQLRIQSDQQSYRIWEEFWYDQPDKKLLSLFLSHLSLDKRHHTFPLGKNASHVTLRCLFFYWSKYLLDGITRSLAASDFRLLTCVPLPFVFLNHLCNQETLLDNHLHIHLGYDSTTVILHLGKHVQEIQSIPFGWKIIDEKLVEHFSPLERESMFMKNDFSRLKWLTVWMEYQKFLAVSLRILFERFGLQWTFNQYTFSWQGPCEILSPIVSAGELDPWIQKNSIHRKLWSRDDEHWLHYWNTLDPVFSLHPHPLLALVRSVFFSDYADS
jgi:hypothetical protein